MNIKTRDLSQIAIFAAIIAVCAQVSIPMPYGVPMTLQTFAIPLAGVVLGAKRGTVATLVYVLLGLAGVPIFAGFTGGLGMLFGKTGGFIVSFPLMAFAAGIGALRGKVWMTMWLVIGAAVNYACGMLMFSYVTENSIAASFGFVVVPFIPTAVIKIIMVLVSGKAIRLALVKTGLVKISE